MLHQNSWIFKGYLYVMWLQKKFFHLTDPHWAHLGTHRHPCGMPSGCPQRANFLDSWAISKIPKTNNIYAKFWIFFDQLDPLGTLGHPWVTLGVPIRCLKTANFFVSWAILKISKPTTISDEYTNFFWPTWHIGYPWAPPGNPRGAH